MSNVVELIPQDKSNACWLASSSMMETWKTGSHYSLSDTLKLLDSSGTDFSSTYNGDGGLSFQDNTIITQTLGLTALPPASYTIEYLTSILDNSPVMAVIMYSSTSNIAHMIVITGISGDGSPESTTMEINDPLPLNSGKTYTIPFNDFISKFEQVVAFENNFPDQDLTSQLFYFQSSTTTDNTSTSGNSTDEDSTSNTSEDPTSTSTDDGSSTGTTDTGPPSPVSTSGGDSVDKDAEGFGVLASGSWNADTKLSYEGGQVMHFQIKNTNVLGTTLSISSNLGGNKSSIILPQQTVDMRFDCFGSEPMGWSFDISTNSDAFITSWKLYSSWLPGDPKNG